MQVKNAIHISTLISSTEESNNAPAMLQSSSPPADVIDFPSQRTQITHSYRTNSLVSEVSMHQPWMPSSKQCFHS